MMYHAENPVVCNVQKSGLGKSGELLCLLLTGVWGCWQPAVVGRWKV